MLLTETLDVLLHQKNIPYYESLGYHIPRIKNKWGRMVIPRGTTINIKLGAFDNHGGVS